MPKCMSVNFKSDFKVQLKGDLLRTKMDITKETVRNILCQLGYNEASILNEEKDPEKRVRKYFQVDDHTETISVVLIAPVPINEKVAEGVIASISSKVGKLNAVVVWDPVDYHFNVYKGKKFGKFIASGHISPRTGKMWLQLYVQNF